MNDEYNELLETALKLELEEERRFEERCRNVGRLAAWRKKWAARRRRFVYQGVGNSNIIKFPAHRRQRVKGDQPEPPSAA